MTLPHQIVQDCVQKSKIKFSTAEQPKLLFAGNNSSEVKRKNRFAMNGYFYVLTTIDFFILCFMCSLTYLSESLSRKQKRGFLF